MTCNLTFQYFLNFIYGGLEYFSFTTIAIEKIKTKGPTGEEKNYSNL